MPEAHYKILAKLNLNSLRGLLAYSFLGSLFLLASLPIHGFVHEVLGHGLFALASGQTFNSFYISPFGNQYSFETKSLEPPLLAFEYAAGSIVSVAVGFLLFFVVYPVVARKSFGASVFMLFIVINFETDMLYPFVSTLIGWGDASEMAQVLHISPPLIVSVFAGLLAIIGFYPILKEYYRLLSSLGEDKTKLFSRFLFVLKILYLPVFAFLVINAIVLLSFSGPAVAFQSISGVLLEGIPLVAVVAWVAFKTSGLSVPLAGKLDESSLSSLFRYAVISIIIIALVVSFFGPTFEYRWGVSW